VTKAEYVEAVSAKTGLTKKDVELTLDSFVSVVSDALANNDRVQVNGLGVFESKLRPEREGRNPATGETIKIKASNSVGFKVAKALKDAVNK